MLINNNEISALTKHKSLYAIFRYAIETLRPLSNSKFDDIYIHYKCNLSYIDSICKCVL